MTLDIIAAFSVILVILVIGDIISIKTKAFVPSVFVSAILFMIGFWTIFPKDLIELSGLGQPFATLAMYLLITHMGTMLSIRELAAQWKTVAIALAGIIGMCIATLTIGKAIFGMDTVVIGTPPLTGGIVAALIMQEAAMEKGLVDLAVLAIVMYIMQGFAGYPLTAIALKREGTRLLTEYRNDSAKIKAPAQKKMAASNDQSKLKLFPTTPEKYQTTYMYLAKLGLTAWASFVFAQRTNEIISRFVVCLIFGVIAAEIGFVERKPLNLSNSFGFLMTALMAFIFAGLSEATPAMLGKLVLPLVGIIVIGVIGMAILSIGLGKILGYSKEMSIATALTALYGFPPNYILTEEASKALAETPEEHKYLMDEMLPKMLVGGFTTVTIASVIIAGIFVKFL